MIGYFDVAHLVDYHGLLAAIPALHVDSYGIGQVASVVVYVVRRTCTILPYEFHPGLHTRKSMSSTANMNMYTAISSASLSLIVPSILIRYGR